MALIQIRIGGWGRIDLPYLINFRFVLPTPYCSGDVMNPKEKFHVSRLIILYKFALGLIEFISGLGIVFLGKQILASTMVQISQELSEDPHDLLANMGVGIVPNIFTHNTFFVTSLILLGFTKIAGAIGLVYKQNWGVDLLVGLTVIMLPFQLINLFVHRSFMDFLYLVLGIVIALYLIQFKPKAWISRVLQKF
jgi:uncharacterized membrane protein